MTGLEALFRLTMGLKARRKEWDKKQYAQGHTITRKNCEVVTGLIVYVDIQNGAILSHVPVRHVEESEFLKDDWEVV